MFVEWLWKSVKYEEVYLQAYVSVSEAKAGHVHEKRITLRALKEMLDALNLDFIGFELDYPDSKSLYRAQHPDDPTMTSLDNWDEFKHQHPHTFENCYKFWVRHKVQRQ